MDLVNRFGQLDGFQILLDRFTKGPPLSVPVVASLIKYVVCFFKKKFFKSFSPFSLPVSAVLFLFFGMLHL